VSNLAIFDTSIFIDNLRAGRHQQRIETLNGLIRLSSVVLAELWRGAGESAERNFLPHRAVKWRSPDNLKPR